MKNVVNENPVFEKDFYYPELDSLQPIPDKYYNNDILFQLLTQKEYTIFDTSNNPQYLKLSRLKSSHGYLFSKYSDNYSSYGTWDLSHKLTIDGTWLDVVFLSQDLVIFKDILFPRSYYFLIDKKTNANGSKRIIRHDVDMLTDDMSPTYINVKYPKFHPKHPSEIIKYLRTHQIFEGLKLPIPLDKKPTKAPTMEEFHLSTQIIDRLIEQQKKGAPKDKQKYSRKSKYVMLFCALCLSIISIFLLKEKKIGEIISIKFTAFPISCFLVWGTRACFDSLLLLIKRKMYYTDDYYNYRRYDAALSAYKTEQARIKEQNGLRTNAEEKKKLAHCLATHGHKKVQESGFLPNEVFKKFINDNGFLTHTYGWIFPSVFFTEDEAQNEVLKLTKWKGVVYSIAKRKKDDNFLYYILVIPQNCIVDAINNIYSD